MSRIKLALAALSALALVTACVGGADESTSAAALFERPFRMTVECASSSGTNSAFVFEYLDADTGSLEFIEPSAVCGMELAREGATVKTQFLGVVREREFSSLERANPLAALFELAAAARSGGETQEDTAEGRRFELPDGAAITAVNGVPRTITLAREGLKLTITSFEYLDAGRAQ